jgi:ferredoxin
MKFSVDQDMCVGCGACEGTCPDVFGLVDDKSRVIIDPVPSEYEGCALEAEGGCPVKAISHE